MVKLAFAGEEGKSRYEICFQAVALADKAIPVSDWDDAVSLIKKLKQAGQPAAERNGNVQLLELATDGVVSLERGELKLLIEMIERPIWKPLFLERVQDARLWLKELKHG